MTQMRRALQEAADQAVQEAIAEMFDLGAMNEAELKAMLDSLEQVMALDVCPYSGTHFGRGVNEPCVMVEADGTFRIGKRNYMEIRALRDGVPCVASGSVLNAINNLYIPLRDARLAEEARIAAETKRKAELIEQVVEIVRLLHTLNAVDRLEMTAEAFDETTVKVATALKVSGEAIRLYFDWRKERDAAASNLNAAIATELETKATQEPVDPAVSATRAIIDYAEAQIRHFDGGGEQTHEYQAQIWGEALAEFRAGKLRALRMLMTGDIFASQWAALDQLDPANHDSSQSFVAAVNRMVPQNVSAPADSLDNNPLIVGIPVPAPATKLGSVRLGPNDIDC